MGGHDVNYTAYLLSQSPLVVGLVVFCWLMIKRKLHTHGEFEELEQKLELMEAARDTAIARADAASLAAQVVATALERGSERLAKKDSKECESPPSH